MRVLAARVGVLTVLVLVAGGCIREAAKGTADSASTDATAVADTTTVDDATTVTDTTTATDAATATDATAPDIASDCGNGVCGAGENKLNCLADCYCGNGTCEAGETRGNCADDCGCGNLVCDGPETKLSCPGDCCADVKCGDCTCDSLCGETIANCPKDCHVCGDGIVSQGELDCGCKEDACRCIGSSGVLGAGCGDGCCMGYQCDETSGNCPGDCQTGCGNHVCDAGETPYTCSEDCAFKACSNGTCEAPPTRTPTHCPSDCGSSCGNCVCEPNEGAISPVRPTAACAATACCSNCPQFKREPETCPADCPP
ncbi:MAG: hypothetical protein U1F43_20390 [Myxococcota bacterium]